MYLMEIKQCGHRVRPTRHVPNRLQPWPLTIWPWNWYASRI